jgi:hypothetical protein
MNNKQCKTSNEVSKRWGAAFIQDILERALHCAAFIQDIL